MIELGGEDVEVMGFQLFQGGHLVARETALEVWASTRKAIDIHMRSVPVEGYLGEVVQANMALVMLATGFETYCDRRFREVPSEGRSADVRRLASTFIPVARRKEEPPGSIQAFLELVRLDFGNYETCRRAFNAAYGLSFGTDVGVPTQTLIDVKRMLEYRHRVVHVSPTEALLNLPHVPPEDPVFANAHLVEELVEATDGFVRSLHAATLALA